MTLIDAVAVLGALAWIPPIVGLIRSALARPQVRVVTQQMVEIGFTTSGPIANIRVAFSTSRKDIVISGVQVLLQHEGGDVRTFSWHGIIQPLGRINSPSGTAFSEKEQSVLAMKLNPRDIEERFIRFQDAKFHTGKRDLSEKMIKKINYMDQTGSIDLQALAKSQEMMDLIAYTKQSFIWQSGKYQLSFRLESPERFIIKDHRYEFMLTPIDIELLERNKGLIDQAYKGEIAQSSQAQPIPTLPWNWRYPVLTMKT